MIEASIRTISAHLLLGQDSPGLGMELANVHMLIERVEPLVIRAGWPAVPRAYTTFDSVEAIVRLVGPGYAFQANAILMAIASAKTNFLMIPPVTQTPDPTPTPPPGPNRPVVQFTDISGHWAHSDIMVMAGIDLIRGTGAGRFSPDSDITYAQFITIAVRATISDHDIRPESGGEAWYARYIESAISLKIIEQGEFSNEIMNAPILREDMATILVRAMQAKGEQTLTHPNAEETISDFDMVSANRREHVKIAYSMGIIGSIDSIGSFSPKDTATRAQAAAVFCRMVFPENRLAPQF